jgi:hypothetical protein
VYTMVDSCIYTCVKGCTGEYAVANTVVVYAYNMWYPCTLYVHVYTQYVHLYAMNIHVLTSCLNMVGRVPLILLFLAGNSTPTIPQQYNQHVGSCDTAAVDGWRDSNVCEVNQWLWQFRRGADTSRRRQSKTDRA